MEVYKEELFDLLPSTKVKIKNDKSTEGKY